MGVAKHAIHHANDVDRQCRHQFHAFRPVSSHLYVQVRKLMDLPWDKLSLDSDTLSVYARAELNGEDMGVSEAVPVQMNDKDVTIKGEFDSPVYHTSSSTLICRVFAKDGSDADKLLGWCYVPLHECTAEWSVTNHMLVQEEQSQYQSFGTLQITSRMDDPHHPDVVPPSFVEETVKVKEGMVGKIKKLEELVKVATSTDADQTNEMKMITLETKKARFLVRQAKERMSELRTQLSKNVE